MSAITFLENARSGENNFWRYFFTIILTWGTPVVFEVFILGFAMFYLVSQGVNMNNMMFNLTSNPLVLILLVGVSSVVSILFLYVGVKFIHKRKFLSLVTTNSKFSFKKLLKGGVVWFAIQSVVTIASLIIEPSSLKFTFSSISFILLLVLSFLVFPIQASFEELFFRGYLMQAFGLLSKKPVVPLLITTVIFSLLHYFNGSYTTLSVTIVLQVFVLGLTLGIITLGENSLETAMGIHISNNIFASLIVNTPDNFGSGMPSLFTDYSQPDPLISTLMMIVYALILITIIFWGKKENLIQIFNFKY